MQPLHRFEFDIYALSLPRGHGFRFQPPVAAWRTQDALGCATLTRDIRNGTFGVLVIRRRTDHVWAVVCREHSFAFKDDALARLGHFMQEGLPPEPLPPGTVRRPALHDLEGREPSEIFRLLAAPTHQAAGWLLNQLYLALPRPDANWASDCQTGNFHTRLWEAQLLASFREQGLTVTQPEESPDFRVENRPGEVGWIEAVTANSTHPYNHVNAPRPALPTAREERFFGSAALRFAKTLGNKLARRYDLQPHVTGHPFALALADFHAGGSLMWSREALIGYLYGEGAILGEVDGQPAAVPLHASHLQGASMFPAGLFSDEQHSELSAVIFSNACSIAKFNRMMVAGGVATPDYRYSRIGEFFDRAPGALRGIPFCLDVASQEYKDLWDCGYEPWCAELEVFHNPHARHPWPQELMPEATHWVEEHGERVCRSHHAPSILWSGTVIQNTNAPPISLERILAPGADAVEFDESRM